MSGLPHLHGRQHVQHAQPSSLQCDPQHPAPDAHANEHLDSGTSSSNIRQNSSLISESRFSNVPASGSIEPTPEYPLQAASRRASNSTSPKDVAFRSQEGPSSAEYPTRQTRSSANASQMRPMYTQLTIGDATEQKQAEFKRVAPSVHNNGFTEVPEPPSPSAMTAGHKRTATGSIKPSVEDQPYKSGVIGAERHRSKSVSSATHGNKIAALSVHLRTRLSYAAAKVEASRRSQRSLNKSPLDLLQGDRFSSIPTIDPFEQVGGGRQGSAEAGSLDGTISAPDTLPNTHLYSSNNHMRLSPTAKSEDSVSSLKSNPRKPPTTLPSLHTIQRLAPPADIIPKNDSSGRRRPNPNDPTSQPQNVFYPRHRRHHSHQSISTIKRNSSSETVLVPETPPLRPLPYNSLPVQQNHSQNSSMEQDAIETLLFMSSPGHSAYCSNTQPSRSQPNHTRRSMTSSAQTKSSAPGSQNAHAIVDTTQPTPGYRGSSTGLEAHAGDEIDRLLDQMDSDSDDEKNYPSSHSNSISTCSTPSGSSHRRKHRFRS
ncbi:uncharacterized protein BDW43DRAFT_270709 [Aspergillus alliaceus]|uniref:uncharacterized protein n=1 Tax=Petromyces alliaceus TaxID=209559 RepID=UPI0012A5F125|nr:uncharacterized protein BDW43DRAFT_270709 [Aspergillus alliaceus]KAB8235564.1 hypothetical protein BDW43DRAFT_270709 [Aspergillus alliaceus]